MASRFPSTPSPATGSASKPDEQAAYGARALREGKLVVLPTETIYGVACLVTRADAMERLNAASSADRSSIPPPPPTWHVANKDTLAPLLRLTSPLHLRIIERLLPGPVRLVIERSPEEVRRIEASLGVPAGSLAPSGEFSIRVPDLALAQRVLHDAGGVVIVERAPNFGLGDGAELDESARAHARALGMEVLDAGATRYGRPSSTLRLLPSGGYRVLAEGVLSEAEVRRRLERLMLFVCTGNTCRSPMAEAIARALTHERPVLAEGQAPVPMRMQSAGVAAGAGGGMTSEAVDALHEMNVDPGRHRSRGLTSAMIEDAEVIFVMTRGHRASVLEEAPEAARKIKLLRPDGGDIPDPIGGGSDDYREAARSIRRAVETRLRELGAAVDSSHVREGD